MNFSLAERLLSGERYNLVNGVNWRDAAGRLTGKSGREENVRSEAGGGEKPPFEAK